MSLISFIEKIQKKPRYVRIQILWLVVFVSMFLIVSLWVVSLKQTFPTTIVEKEESFKELKENVPTLIETLRASISGLFDKDEPEEFLKQENQAKDKKEIIKEKSEEIQPARLPLSF